MKRALDRKTKAAGFPGFGGRQRAWFISLDRGAIFFRLIAICKESRGELYRGVEGVEKTPAELKFHVHHRLSC